MDLEGNKEVLALRACAEESKEGWLGLLHDLRTRGATQIDLIVTGGHGGLLAALTELFAATPRPTGQSWRTFLCNHGGEIWACDFLQVTDLFFHSLFAFFIIELQSRKVIHVRVTRSPTDVWTAQQLREATPPRANAICERFLGSVRRECLDHMLILSEKQLHRVLRAYIEYFNRARPHQGIHQQVPERTVTSVVSDQLADRIISVPILGGLHHEYRRVA